MTNQNIQDNKRKNKVLIQKNDRILFIGDSITDVDRNRSDGFDLGEGFPNLIATQLLHNYPDHELTILNRGISGDRVIDLKNRWKEDCLELNPDLVTILVGINDVGSVINERKVPTEQELEEFEKNYRFLLESLVQKTGAKIILIEPFVLPYPEDRLNWRKQLDPRIQITRRLADDYDALLIPLDGILNAKGIASDYSVYTGDDGVHPTLKGHTAIAEAWFACLNL